jgi:hypothetical protein
VSQLAVITRAVQAGAPPARVLYFEDDGSYLLLDADAPEDANEHDPQDLVVICPHCLLERNPAAGRGMDAAQRTGEARYQGGAWIEGES